MYFKNLFFISNIKIPISQDQPIYSVMKREVPIPIEFIKNMPSDEKLEDIINSPLKSKLICLDDFGMLYIIYYLFHI